MSTFEVFRRAERIEAVCAAIYAALARQFRDDEAARMLFVRLEDEELQHAARVRLLAASYRNDSRMLPRVGGSSALEACLADAERALADVQAGGWGSDLAAVKRRAAELEARLSRAHADVLMESGNRELRGFFTQLASLDTAHAELLGP